MKQRQPGSGSEKPTAPWENTSFANLVRFASSRVYFARIRIGGKLIRRQLIRRSLRSPAQSLGQPKRDDHQLEPGHARSWESPGSLLDSRGLRVLRSGARGRRPRWQRQRPSASRCCDPVHSVPGTSRLGPDRSLGGPVVMLARMLKHGGLWAM